MCGPGFVARAADAADLAGAAAVAAEAGVAAPDRAGLGVERALLGRAIEGAAARGARALTALVPAGDPVRLNVLTGQGFVRTPAGDVAGQLALTRII